MITSPKLILIISTGDEPRAAWMRETLLQAGFTSRTVYRHEPLALLSLERGLAVVSATSELTPLSGEHRTLAEQRGIALITFDGTSAPADFPPSTLIDLSSYSHNVIGLRNQFLANVKAFAS